ncbi:MAG: hypothetical protein ACRDRN_05590 [Sciscionella sp.]
MIVSAAVVPHPPLLLPGVTGSPVSEVEELRHIAEAATLWVLEQEPDALVLVGGASTTEWWEPAESSPVATFAPGVRHDAGRLPLSLAVARALLPATAVPVASLSVAFDGPRQEALALGASLANGPNRVGLVVAGDGSARRGVRAPGHLDERAASFDAELGKALQAGDTATLRALDVRLADELLAHGRAALQVLAGAVGARPVDAYLDYEADPFGVWYGVCRWRIR